MEIREAGTNSRPSAEVFEFKPATTSPVYSSFRKSMEVRNRTNSWRGSVNSIASVDKATQTDEDGSKTASHSPVKTNSQPPSPIRKETEHVQESSDDGDEVTEGESSLQESSHVGTAVPVVVRARMVSVPKRLPPLLPPRNPKRASQAKNDDRDADGFDTVSLNGSEHSGIAQDKTKAGAEAESSTDKVPSSRTDGSHQSSVNGAHGVGTEDEFHSVPPSPAKDKLRGIPGAF